MTAYVDAPTKTIETTQGNTFAYREVGDPTGIPLIGVIHLSGNLDNWDPVVIDGLAKKHHLLLPDYLGVGGSVGRPAATIQEMATDMLEFIHHFGFTKVDILGFSMGGFVAQEMITQEPELIHRAILTGTGPRGGRGISDVTRISDRSLVKAILTREDVKTYSFFTRTPNGKQRAHEFLSRLKLRQCDRDQQMTWPVYRKQLKAINKWGAEQPIDFSGIAFPVLVANGENDLMVPTRPNSYELAKAFKKSRLVTYPDAGHAGVFQYGTAFVKEANQFLQ